MATTADRLLRDHIRYTGDGLPNEPTGAALPIGDPSSGIYNPSKKDLRDAINSVGGSTDAANEAADRANAAAEVIENFIENLPPIVMIFAGQSNMRATPGQTGGDLTPNDNVYFWNSQTSPEANGTAWVRGEIGSSPFIGNSDVNSIAFQAAKEMQKRTGRPVYGILVASGGHHIEAFMNPVDLAANGWSRTPGERANFEFLIAQAAAALPLVPGSPTTADYFFWHQGEANRTDGVELYAHKMRWMLRRYESNGLITINKTDIVAGEIAVSNASQNGRYRERHLNALRRLQIATRLDAFPRFKIARSVTLRPVANDDQLHFYGLDITAFAKRYVDAAFSTQDPPILDPLYCDMTPDGGLGWSTNFTAGRSQNINDYQRREPVYLADTILDTIQHSVLGWCYSPKDGTNTLLYSRMIWPTDPYSQLMIPITVRNIGSIQGSFGLGVGEYDVNGVFLRDNIFTAQILAPGATSKHFATFGAAGNGRSNLRDYGADAAYVGLYYRFNPGSTVEAPGSQLAIQFQNPKFL